MEAIRNERPGRKNERLLTVSSVKGMKLLWRYKTDNVPREMHALFPPLIVGRVVTAAGPRQVAIVAGVSDNIYAIDVATGALLWKHHFDTTFSPPPGVSFGTLCPGGITATPVIGPGKTPGSYIVYAAAWDGRLHQLDVATGKAVAPSELFMPPNAKPYALNLFNSVIYTTSAQGCGGNPNYVYALRSGDAQNRHVRSWQRRHVGTQRPVDRQRRTVYTGTGDGSYNPELRSYGTAIIGVKHRPDDEGAEAQGLLRSAQRGISAEARYRPAGDRAGLRSRGPRVDRAGRARNAAPGCSTQVHWVARIIRRPSIGRRSSATKIRTIRPPASTARWQAM